MDNLPYLPDARASIEKDRLLTDLPVGAVSLVTQLAGGKQFVTRLAMLGLTTGVQVRVVQNFGRGPMIVEVRGTRMALGRNEALKIRVET